MMALSTATARLGLVSASAAASVFSGFQVIPRVPWRNVVSLWVDECAYWIAPRHCMFYGIPRRLRRRMQRRVMSRARKEGV